MDLYVLRHGKAGKRMDHPGDDRLRPLTPKGRKEITGIARWFRETGREPDWVATSPLTRARETAEIVVQELGIRDRLEEWETLAVGEEPEGVLDQLSRKDPGSTGMIVGHEPQLSESLGLLIVAGGSTRISLAKGGVAKVGELFFGPEPSGTLEWLVTPELLIR